MQFTTEYRTKYHGPTNTKGARISCTSIDGRVFVDYDHSLTGVECHAVAVRKMLDKQGIPWSKVLTISSHATGYSFHVIG